MFVYVIFHIFPANNIKNTFNLETQTCVSRQSREETENNIKIKVSNIERKYWNHCKTHCRVVKRPSSVLKKWKSHLFFNFLKNIARYLWTILALRLSARRVREANCTSCTIQCSRSISVRHFPVWLSGGLFYSRRQAFSVLFRACISCRTDRIIFFRVIAARQFELIGGRADWWINVIVQTKNPIGIEWTLLGRLFGLFKNLRIFLGLWSIGNCKRILKENFRKLKSDVNLRQDKGPFIKKICEKLRINVDYCASKVSGEILKEYLKKAVELKAEKMYLHLIFIFSVLLSLSNCNDIINNG